MSITEKSCQHVLVVATAKVKVNKLTTNNQD